MGAPGVLFALTDKEARKLVAHKTDEDRLAYLQEELETWTTS